MPGQIRAIIGTLAITALAACQSAWPKQRVMVSPQATLSLEGGYRWVSLDGKAAPQEFPANSGNRLVYGTLDLRQDGRFSMRFTVEPARDTARTTGQDGRFAINGDTLLFTPDGMDARPPVTFRYAWRSTGELTLTDAQNHVWVYARR